VSDIGVWGREIGRVGHTAGVTGYFGSLTEKAVEAFQSENSVAAVGIVGPKTRALLNGMGW